MIDRFKSLSLTCLEFLTLNALDDVSWYSCLMEASWICLVWLLSILPEPAHHVEQLSTANSLQKTSPGMLGGGVKADPTAEVNMWCGQKFRSTLDLMK